MTDKSSPTDPIHARGGSGATIADVAQAAGVSVATVSRALSGNYPVAKATRERIFRSVTDLGYVANAHARALAGATTRTVGIIINDVADPFFAYIARGVERQASAEGRLCLITATHGDKERELALVDLMREQRTDAVIVVGGASDDPRYRKQMADRARALAAAGSALVLCGRPSLGPGVPTKMVTYDNEGGAFAITDYLISQGHRRILYVGGPRDFSTTASRLAGFYRALDARGIERDPALVHEGAFGRGFGYSRMRELLEQDLGFTAVFGANDLVAAGILEALEERGIRVPEDISVVGYDDVPVASELRPRLTTVRVPLEELGREAVRLALAQSPHDAGASSDNTLTVGTHIVIRDSVSPPKQS
ncbi:LacI family transcriptional regulator [Arthrobacter sp. NtRootA4]|uniref:LacI family DNA-binding transcriptional regulator n=1 Tax=Paenarthrobacter histidinolovorans TaxID=43664 RepID=UPI0009EAA935|nr:LacI family DNA-binding transcriptional regulator [Paenarthrobacter histidinolovorans]BCW11753.1 LacI family transcriptional regulator [Arthrobacter sp. NtRootA2]BCW15837.1 LacI family transcriptional regulator [Arthrobacter sp. NtRootA4]BCW24170.1 LacI family transcriptional regulator [Arthrobacter sp. NtRootC7]BCW28438.1 LacI family transcriptional regulator [Arthrobacter sp. NtRootC45]BCW32709.1 LacI family transcriptional regulator [Arthrobacter sp. NtRootD5]